MDRALDPEILAIADAERAVAVAGVMGGFESEVTENTTDVLIECAYFDPKRIRRGAKALGLDTDASHRFQRGVDPEGAPRALRRVVELILGVAGGRVEGPAGDAYPRPWAPTALRVRPRRVSLLLGVDIPAEEVAAHLAPLGLEPRAVGADETAVEVTVPSWRPDLTREVDLIEEVARRRGYGSFPDELRPFRVGRTEDAPAHRAVDRIRDGLVRAGFREARSVAFAARGEGEIRIANPLSEEEAYLRRWLLTGLVRRVERNFARRVRDVRLFEVGTVFLDSGGELPAEEVHVAAAWSGGRAPPHWSRQPEDWDAYDLKALLEEFAPQITGPGCVVRPVNPGDSSALPFESVEFAVLSSEGEWLGGGGRIREGALDAPPWAGPVWGFELRCAHLPAAIPQYAPLPVLPPVGRDLAVLLPRDLPAAAVEDVIRGAAPETLESVAPFDVYEGPNVPAGRRSIAWRLRFRAPDRTLTDAEVDQALQVIIQTLKEKLDVSIRGG